jgi:hypothetical protein
MTYMKKKLRWTVSWKTYDEPPIFNSVKFPSLRMAVITCYRLWRAGHHDISLKRFRGGRTFDPAMDNQPLVELRPTKTKYHYDCVANGLNPAPLEVAVIHNAHDNSVHYTVRCPMCWTYSGFHAKEGLAWFAWHIGQRIAVKGGAQG